MKRNYPITFIATLFVLGYAASGARSAMDDAGQMSSQAGGQTAQKDPEQVIKGWPPKPQAAAHDFLQKYGQPDTVTRGMLAWNDKGDWKRVAVYQKAFRAGLIPSNVDCIENTVSYDVPAGKAGDLKDFSRALRIDWKKGTLAHRGDSESENILALNLANEIVTGKRDVASARDFMKKTWKESLAGKSSPYMEKLMFRPGSSPGH